MIAVPRDAHNRYRLYVLEDDGLRLLATGPTGEHIGCALVTLQAEGEWDASGRVGVLDTRASEEGSGVWIVNPYA